MAKVSITHEKDQSSQKPEMFSDWTDASMIATLKHITTPFFSLLPLFSVSVSIHPCDTVNNVTCKRTMAE